MRTLRQKVDVELKDARVGWGMEGVKNAYPSTESALKMRTLGQKVRFEASKARTLRSKVRQKCGPWAENACLNPTDLSQARTFGRRVLEPLDLY